MRASWSIGCILAAASFSGAAEPAGKLVRETWDAAYLDGQKAGHFRTTVHEIAGKDGPFLRVRRELRLSVKRGPDVARIHAETGNDETPEGRLLGVSHMMALGTNQQLKISGKVIDGVLHDSPEGLMGNKTKQTAARRTHHAAGRGVAHQAGQRQARRPHVLSAVRAGHQ